VKDLGCGKNCVCVCHCVHTAWQGDLIHCIAINALSWFGWPAQGSYNYPFQLTCIPPPADNSTTGTVLRFLASHERVETVRAMYSVSVLPSAIVRSFLSWRRARDHACCGCDSERLIVLVAINSYVVVMVAEFCMCW
jgi:hypothetical protein